MKAYPPSRISSKTRRCLVGLTACWLAVGPGVWVPAAEVIVEHRPEGGDGPPFEFRQVPRPSDRDTAARALFRVLEGEPDENGAGVEALRDGRWPAGADEPEANFFFAAGTPGGRVLVDFGRATPIRSISSYSRHPGSRGPQVYVLYGATGQEPGFRVPEGGDPPDEAGWTRIAEVDTRSLVDPPGGQYGVWIVHREGVLGPFRYLLFDMRATQRRDPFGNTFYSEIDVVSADPEFVPTPPEVGRGPDPFTVRTADGRFAFTIDLSQAPELESWVRQRLLPIVLEWYPKLAELLPVEGVTPPEQVRIVFRPGRGVAAASGTRITANSRWIDREREGEAAGAIIHELVHVLQQYGRRPPGSAPPPGWLVEGIADYVRWFVYEPESHGADLVWLRRQGNLQLRHDASYRISANFLDWVSRRYDRELVRHLNAALRLGRYEEALWEQRTGKTLQELAETWRKETMEALAAP